MTEPLDRDQVITLLNNLGSERDEDALAAAREVHAKIAAAGLSWQDLLQPAGNDEEPEGDEPDEEYADSEAEPQDEPQVPFEAKDEALALIAKLLAKKGISEALREELEDYKTDIGEGEFGQGDLNYLQAVSSRLKAG